MNLDEYRGIWVYVEVRDGQIAPVSRCKTQSPFFFGENGHTKSVF